MEERWKEASRRSFLSAQLLYDNEDFRGCANRSYYSAYQAATAECLRHGDHVRFPPGWNNPAHEQLPELIRNNGSLGQRQREQINRDLRFLRNARETGDYRPGRTVDKMTARDCLRNAASILKILGVDRDE